MELTWAPGDRSRLSYGPITPFLNGENFNSETTRVMGVVLGAAAGDCADDVKQAIANKLIALAKTGEHNPDVLCDHALEDICRPQHDPKKPTVTVAR